MRTKGYPEELHVSGIIGCNLLSCGGHWRCKSERLYQLQSPQQEHSDYENQHKKSILAGDEADELRDAFLNSLLSILSNFTVGRESLLHDPTDIRDGEKPVLLPNIRPRALLPALVTAATGTVRMLRRCLTVRHSSSSSKTLTTPQKHQANKPFHLIRPRVDGGVHAVAVVAHPAPLYESKLESDPLSLEDFEYRDDATFSALFGGGVTPTNPSTKKSIKSSTSTRSPQRTTDQILALTEQVEQARLQRNEEVRTQAQDVLIKLELSIT
nr:hypothetical protein PanWU01x14_356960 [Ipomoea trifida]